MFSIPSSRYDWITVERVVKNQTHPSIISNDGDHEDDGVDDDDFRIHYKPIQIKVDCLNNDRYHNKKNWLENDL